METISEVEAKRREAAAVHAILEYAYEACECLHYEPLIWGPRFALRLNVIPKDRVLFFKRASELELDYMEDKDKGVLVLMRYQHDFLT